MQPPPPGKRRRPPAPGDPRRRPVRRPGARPVMGKGRAGPGGRPVRKVRRRGPPPPPPPVPQKEKKAKKALLELSRPSLIMGSISTVLIILTLILTVKGTFQLIRKVKFGKALHSHDSYQIDGAKDALESTIGWHSENAEARILLAKIHVERGNWNEAEEQYQAVEDLGTLVDLAKIGRGIMYLRRADASDKPDEITEFVGKAEAALSSAKGIEKKIALATAKLIRARRLGGDIDAARTAFASAMTAAQSSPPPTLEACMDLYGGLSAAGHDSSRYVPQAAEAARAYLQYDPGNLVALQNLIVFEAQTFEFDLHEIPDTDMELFRKTLDIRVRSYMGALIRDHQKSHGMRSALMTFMLSVAYWHLQRRAWDDALEMVQRQLKRPEFRDHVEPELLNIYVCKRLCQAPKFARRAHMLNVTRGHIQIYLRGGYAKEEKKLKAKYPTLKADLLHMMAYARYMVWMDEKDPNMVRDAIGELEEADTALPGDYAIQRNLAVALRVREEYEKAQALLPKLEEAAGESGAFAEDLKKVRQFLMEE